jgi:hypothetical protein
MWPLQRYIKRRLNRINRKLIIIITFLSLVAMIAFRTNERAWEANSNSKVPYEAFGAERKGKRSEPKQYLSYQPPGGGWNNQRIAFENAVIMAAMLKRTLLVQPLAPHDRMLELKTQYNQSAGYTIYNMLTAKELVPISKLIDLDRLSSSPLSVPSSTNVRVTFNLQ